MHVRWTTILVVCSALGCSSSSGQPASDAGSEVEVGSGVDAAAGGSCSGAHFLLDPKDGKCKLDGTTTNVGAPCMGAISPACGTEPTASCLDPVLDDFPGGYCNVDPCSAADGHLCPIGSSCVQLNGENGQCFKDCSTNSDCRTSDGYFCLDMTADDHPGGLWISGASHKVCSRAIVTCPASPADCPFAIPHCVLPDGGAAYTDAGPDDSGASDGAPVAPPTPICVK
jgi:hypothetical protein